MPKMTPPTAKAAYVQKPFQVSYKEVKLRRPGAQEARIEVLACGICGYDMEVAEFLADKPCAIGHEVVGIVREAGSDVTHVKVGDQVVLESGSFCCDCALCRNGRVDLCNKGAGIWKEPAMGFSEAMIAPARAIVPAPDIDPLAAVLAEPCGVGIDIVKVAEIGLTDRVLVVGAGPIGLMALAIARRRTTGALVAADRVKGRLEVAKRLGAEDVIVAGENALVKYAEKHGAFDRILITAPPMVIPECITAAAFGGYLVFIGSDFKGGGVVPIDTHAVHYGKKQLRASFASPALYLPEALHLLRTGIVPAGEIVSHKFPLSKLQEAMQYIREHRDTTYKVAVIPDARFTG